MLVDGHPIPLKWVILIMGMCKPLMDENNSGSGNGVRRPGRRFWALFGGQFPC